MMSGLEEVAVVDGDNTLIGSAPRHRMRSERLIHRATYIFVFDSAGWLQVQKRTMTKDIYPGCYDAAAGGVVLAGESYEQGAARELAEEMGIRGVPLRTHGDFYFEDDYGRVWGRVYSCTWDGPIVPQAEEVASVHRMLPEDVLAGRADGPFTPDSGPALRVCLSATP